MRRWLGFTAGLVGCVATQAATVEEQPTGRSPEPSSLVSTVASSPAPAPTFDAAQVIVERRLSHSRLLLTRDAQGVGHLFGAQGEASPLPVRCDDRLQGAWGLWVDDIDGDGRAEAIVALHKRAKFDDTLANRLHVYGFEDGRCVPAWRGTRLAGRFDAATTVPDDRGALVVHEWLSPTRRRVARYRWHGFGYRLEHVQWQGSTPPPADVIASLHFGPSPVPAGPAVSPGLP